MFLINTTPHQVNIHTSQEVISIDSHAEYKLRVSSEIVPIGAINGISLTKPVFSRLEIPENLVEALKEGETWVICSLITAQAVKGQYPEFADYFLVPQQPVRDENGVIRGCESFCRASDI